MVDRSVSIVLSLRNEEFSAEMARLHRQMFRENVSTRSTGQVLLRDSRGRFRSVESLADEVVAAAKVALEQAARAVQEKVREYVPYWRRGLPVYIDEENAGRDQVIYGRGVVFHTHEKNGQWSRMPPHAPIKQWVAGKLGVSGKEGDLVAWAVQKKIKNHGLTLPNIESRGQMIQRTKADMESTDFHFRVFSRALKVELRRI